MWRYLRLSTVYPPCEALISGAVVYRREETLDGCVYALPRNINTPVTIVDRELYGVVGCNYSYRFVVQIQYAGRLGIGDWSLRTRDISASRFHPIWFIDCRKCKYVTTDGPVYKPEWRR